MFLMQQLGILQRLQYTAGILCWMSVGPQSLKMRF